MQRTRGRSFFILLVCWLLIAMSATAAGRAFIVAGSDQALILNRFVGVYESKTSITPIQALCSIQTGSLPKVDAPYSVAFTNSYIWLYLPIFNPGDSSQDLILSLENPHIDSLFVYEIENASNIIRLVGKGGDKMLFNERNYFHRNFIFPLQLKSGDRKTFLVMLNKRNASLSYPLRLWENKSFIEFDELLKVRHGIFIGVFLFIAFFSLLVGWLTQLSLFKVYGVYVLVICIYVISDWGYLFQYLFPDSIHINNYIRVVFTFFFNLMMVVFSISYLAMKRMMPKVVSLLYGVLILEFAGIWILFLMRSYLELYGIYILRFSYILLFFKYSMIIYFLVFTFRQQLFVNVSYLLSVGFVIVASVLIILIEFGIVSEWYFYVQLLSIGSFVEILLLSVLITYRIRSIYMHRVDLMQQLAEQKKRIIKAFINGGDRERNFISQELHDNVGTKLVLLKNSMLRNQNTENIAVVDSVISEVRQLTHRISPSTLPLIGFKESVQGLIEECHSTSGLNISHQAYNLPALTNDQSIQLYRILQEALKNIVQHAWAQKVEIQLIGYPDQLVITIDDDGKGTDSTKMIKGLGISNMRSRVDSLNGTFELSSIPGQGTSILITIPVV